MNNFLITLLLLVLVAYHTKAFVTNHSGVRQGRWAILRHSSNSRLRMSSAEKSITAEEINTRLEKQLEKLKAKDATSKNVNKEVNKRL